MARKKKTISLEEDYPKAAYATRGPVVVEPDMTVFWMLAAIARGFKGEDPKYLDMTLREFLHAAETEADYYDT